MFIGSNARYKDKRVDKILDGLGYDSYEIFYSPLVVSVTYLFMFLATGGYLIFFLLGQWLFILVLSVSIYACIFYLVAAYSNNSFAITSDKLIIVNPNFPFRKHVIIPLEVISSIYIGEHTTIWRSVILLFTNNYVDVRVGNNTTRYYCIGLEADAFDENLTEKTIEDFICELRKRNVEVTVADKINN